MAESFLPHMNGVTGSVLQILRHLANEGHETLVIAPKAGDVETDLRGADLSGARTTMLRSVPLPSYPQVRVVFARAAKLAEGQDLTTDSDWDLDEYIGEQKEKKVKSKD